MQESTTIHELGHHIHLNGADPLDPALNRAIELAYMARVERQMDPKTGRPRVRVRGGAWVPSSYSRANHKEWFAETHSAFVQFPETLKAKDPEAFALIRRVRKARGMT
jgi:hypothetical protein